MSPDGGVGALRVLIVDDHAVFRGALRELLEKDGCRVVAEADGAEEGVSRARELAPDLVIMDVRLRGGVSGIEAARRLQAEAPESRILMLSASDRFGDAEEAILAGACGYLLKDSSEDAIAAGVRAAAEGDSPLSPRIAAELLRRYREDRAPAERSPLTDREGAVLRLMMDGRSNPEIAAELAISKQTVKNHVSSVLGKLGVENRTQAAAEAVRRGLA
jgi:two-component system, NarL family, response regulator LiaR